MKINLTFDRSKNQFYSPTLKKLLGREQLNDMIEQRVITEIVFLGTPDEKQEAMDYLSYKPDLSLTEKLGYGRKGISK